jgi:hypothetical protein
VTKAEPERDPSTGIRLDVEYQCDGKRCKQLSFCSEDIDPCGLPSKTRVDPRTISLFTAYPGFSVTRVDRDNLFFLAVVTESLCMHLLRGESIKAWCMWWGMGPQSLRGEAKGEKTRSRRMRPLVINFPNEAFILERPEFLRIGL